VQTPWFFLNANDYSFKSLTSHHIGLLWVESTATHHIMQESQILESVKLSKPPVRHTCCAFSWGTSFWFVCLALFFKSLVINQLSGVFCIKHRSLTENNDHMKRRFYQQWPMNLPGYIAIQEGLMQPECCNEAWQTRWHREHCGTFRAGVTLPPFTSRRWASFPKVKGAVMQFYIHGKWYNYWNIHKKAMFY